MLVLKVTPAEASYLVIWVSVFGIVGRFLVTAIIDRWGRRVSGVLCSLLSAAAISVAGQMPGIYIGDASLFYIMILITVLFASGNYAIASTVTCQQS